MTTTFLLGLDHPLPHNHDMECCVLGCYIQEPAKAFDIACSLAPEDFYVPLNRTLFRACRALSERDLHWDIPMLANHLYHEESQAWDNLGVDGIRALRNSVPTIANLEKYVGVIRRLGVLRRSIDLCRKTIEEAYEANAADAPKVIDQLERGVMDLSTVGSDIGFVHVKDSIQMALEDIDGMAAHDPDFCGIPTGLRALDRVIIGLRPGDMVVIGARPSIGKTALLQCILRRIAEFHGGKYPTGMISIEMSRRALTRRNVLEDAQINGRDIFNGRIPKSEWGPAVRDAAERLRRIPMYHYDSSCIWPDIRRTARQGKMRDGICVLGIDYLQLMQLGEKTHSREHEVALMSSGMKQLAKELGIPLIVLAQLNRSAEDKKPKLSELRESGAIEQDADIVALLHRTRQTDDLEIAEAIARGEGIPTDLIVAKNRDGATGIAELMFYPQYTRFDDMPRTTPEDEF